MIQLNPGTVLYVFTTKDGREVLLRTPKCARVFENNEPAISLYERMGYMLTGRVPEAVLYKGECVDSLIMTKKLPVK